MQTVRGHYNGNTIELLDQAPVDSESYVLVTFLDSTLQTAIARGQRVRYKQDPQHPPYSDELRKHMASQYIPSTVGSIMTRRVISIVPTAKVTDALNLMRSQGITSILVEPDNDGGEWGIMTMRDLLKQVIVEEHSPDDIHVSTIASKPLITVAPDTNLSECSKLLLQNKIRRVVVCQDGQYIGIVSDTDIFQVIQEQGLV